MEACSSGGGGGVGLAAASSAAPVAAALPALLVAVRHFSKPHSEQLCTCDDENKVYVFQCSCVSSALANQHALLPLQPPCAPAAAAAAAEGGKKGGAEAAGTPSATPGDGAASFDLTETERSACEG